MMTHRLFSRNAASSRAIPVKTAIELIQADTAMPIHWGKNQPGMSAREECMSPIQITTGSEFACEREAAWRYARDRSIEVAEAFARAGYHKQIVNRLLEPYTHIKVVLTATEFENFFWLRKHRDAQPEIHQLAIVMWEAYDASTPIVLSNQGWHVPYYIGPAGAGCWEPSGYVRQIPNADELGYELVPMDDKRGCTLEEAIAISSSCCAQVSYRKTDDSLEKALSIHTRLIEAMPPHFSPFEHQATPMRTNAALGEAGITHMDAKQDLWSGNFRGWIQQRQLLMVDLDLEPMSSAPGLSHTTQEN